MPYNGTSKSLLLFLVLNCEYFGQPTDDPILTLVSQWLFLFSVKVPSSSPEHAQVTQIVRLDAVVSTPANVLVLSSPRSVMVVVALVMVHQMIELRKRSATVNRPPPRPMLRQPTMAMPTQEIPEALEALAALAPEPNSSQELAQVTLIVRLDAVVSTLESVLVPSLLKNVTGDADLVMVHRTTEPPKLSVMARLQLRPPLLPHLTLPIPEAPEAPVPLAALAALAAQTVSTKVLLGLKMLVKATGHSLLLVSVSATPTVHLGAVASIPESVQAQ